MYMALPGISNTEVAKHLADDVLQDSVLLSVPLVLGVREPGRIHLQSERLTLINIDVWGNTEDDQWLCRKNNLYIQMNSYVLHILNIPDFKH